MTDSELDALLAAARVRPAPPSEALMERVLADALVEAAARASPEAVPRRHPRRRPLAGLVAALGGWPAMAGLATAGIVGLWIGYAAPLGIDTITAAMLGGGYGPADLMPSLDAYLTEG